MRTLLRGTEVRKGVWYLYVPSSRYAFPKLIRLLSDRHNGSYSALVYTGRGHFGFTTPSRAPFVEMSPTVFYPETSEEEVNAQAFEFLKSRNREDQW